MRVPIVCVDARLRQYAQTFADCFTRLSCAQAMDGQWRPLRRRPCVGRNSLIRTMSAPSRFKAIATALTWSSQSMRSTMIACASGTLA
jgi:hypothetical protein